MKRQAQLIAVAALSLSSVCSAQTFQISRPPISGYFEGDSLFNIANPTLDPIDGVTLFSDSAIIYASGGGKVTGRRKANDGWIIVIEYPEALFIYKMLDTVYVQKDDSVAVNRPIGRLKFIDDDKKYEADVMVLVNGKEIRDKDLVPYLHTKKIDTAK